MVSEASLGWSHTLGGKLEGKILSLQRPCLIAYVFDWKRMEIMLGFARSFRYIVDKSEVGIGGKRPRTSWHDSDWKGRGRMGVCGDCLNL